MTLPDKSLSHAFFRCHDRNNFFKHPLVKLFLLVKWAKYKRKHGIQIFDFMIMENHAHMLVRVSTAEQMGDFMRTVNSQLARFINKLFDRDSQAIRERYKSPVIEDEFYFRNVRSYIWLNRYKVNKSDPRYDPFCSLSWRLNPEILKTLGFSEEELELVRELLDDYPEGTFDSGVPLKRSLVNALNAAKSRIQEMADAFFKNSHTIGSDSTIAERSELFAAFRREKARWKEKPPNDPNLK